ncbi:MAG TPA: GntR family transcriptional regulator, partial [Casimicrobiaceae bacterium]
MSAVGASGAPIAPLNRRSLHDEVVDRVRSLIVEGHLPPQTRIHEGDLGKALGVSRTPLREALKVLASEGLIDLVPGRGAIVRKLTDKDVREMLDV